MYFNIFLYNKIYMTIALTNKKISDSKYSKHNPNYKNNEIIINNDIIKNNVINNSDNKEDIKSENNKLVQPNKNMDKRCNHIECMKKLRISDMKCKCEFIFCLLHRLPEQHNCLFDYKNSQDFDKIINNMKCTSTKIEKI